MLSGLNALISNILLMKSCSHCRLCLRDIQEMAYVELEDSVSIGLSIGNQQLSHILCKLMGPQIYDDIPGLEAVCKDCLDKVIQIQRFIEKCRNSVELLNTIFNNFFTTLNTDVELPDTKKDQSLYIVVDEDHSEVIIVSQKHKLPSKKQFQCDKCEQLLNTNYEIVTHNAQKHNSVTCEKCVQSFKDNSELFCHLKSKHLYACTECNYNGENDKQLLKHQDTVHKEYLCKICKKTITGLIKYQRHEEKHNSKRPCPHCGKLYQTLDSFNRHVDLCMQGLIDPHPMRSALEKNYICSECNKGYSTPGGLRVHKRFAHENANPHVCKLCNKKFVAPSCLKAHMVTHTRERNFDCTTCGHKFVTKEALLYHTRRHTGEKPYSCKFCNHRFVNASARSEHIKFKHIGPKLMCEICSHKFFTKSFLQQHISRHYDPASRLYCGRSIGAANKLSATTHKQTL